MNKRKLFSRAPRLPHTLYSAIDSNKTNIIK